uniref:Uncharacterized protein n=1 Tax=viral metagenome TaxID=1070528 RepID=A0A6C0KTS1_9ZZZZ
MDLTPLKTAVQHELTIRTGVSSLILQNHIYGCYLIMEDIANNVLEFSDYCLKNSSFTLDLTQNFSKIGIRYGFLMDTKLILDSVQPAYQEEWMKIFEQLHSRHEIEEVDQIEDLLNELIQKTIPSEDSFFLHALETGRLPQEWMDKVLKLFEPPTSSEVTPEVTPLISQAKTEKNPVKKTYLSTTRRHKPIVVPQKKSLASTRRAKCVTNK